MKLTVSVKSWIDSLDHEALLHGWRFGKPCDLMFAGETGEYWQKRMKELRKAGANHVAASKAVGWGK